MMRLNGWQRIGVVLSVVWIVAGGFWTRRILFDEYGYGVANRKYVSCLQGSREPGAVACERQYSADLQRVYDESGGAINSLNLGLTLVPLVAAWLLVYALVGIGRWIRAGFRA